MIQSGGILDDLLTAIPQAMFLTGSKTIRRTSKREVTEKENKVLL